MVQTLGVGPGAGQAAPGAFDLLRSHKVTLGSADFAVIEEEKESTAVVGEDASVSVDEYGFLWIRMSSVSCLALKKVL